MWTEIQKSQNFDTRIERKDIIQILQKSKGFQILWTTLYEWIWDGRWNWQILKNIQLIKSDTRLNINAFYSSEKRNYTSETST